MTTNTIKISLKEYQDLLKRADDNKDRFTEEVKRNEYLKGEMARLKVELDKAHKLLDNPERYVMKVHERKVDRYGDSYLHKTRTEVVGYDDVVAAAKEQLKDESSIRVKVLEEELTNLKKDIATLKRNRDDLQMELVDVQQRERAAYNREADRLRDNLTNRYEDKIKGLNKKINNLEEELEAVRSDKTERDLERLHNEQLTNLREQIEALEEENKLLEKSTGLVRRVLRKPTAKKIRSNRRKLRNLKKQMNNYQWQINEAVDNRDATSSWF